ncbi:tail fiber protein [Bradyrhizobium sp. SZCCHNR3112]|uniref:tail fiber protein n=1 Tax=Bradyrhizobium sp. SZCCHNR3112 TaxID=3057464 RepID=UPI002916A312|nr:tail fiber protein [Bradyrhizobium sp. SZCCHNR3112]
MTLYKWSQTANTNASADSTINWAEGQLPSSINDSARGMMAATSKYRDDIAGAIVTAGTSSAYTVSSYQVFDTLTHLNGQMIAFTPHVTNAGTCTLNVDSLGAKPLRSAPNADLLAGTIIQGTPYTATYNNTDGVFYLQGFYGNPYNIPLAASIEYWLPTTPNSSFTFLNGAPISRTTYSALFSLMGTTFGAGDGSTTFNIPLAASIEYWLPTTPNSSFTFLNGAPISRTTYSALFSLMGTTFGAGDGSTTFNIPDCRGRVVACPDVFGGSGDPNRLTNGPLASVRNSIGGAGGEAAHTLTLGELPTGISSSGSNSITVTSSQNIAATPGSIGSGFAGSSGNLAPVSASNWNGITSLSANNNIGVTSSNTGGGAHFNMQPTILANRIMRII